MKLVLNKIEFAGDPVYLDDGTEIKKAAFAEYIVAGFSTVEGFAMGKLSIMLTPDEQQKIEEAIKSVPHRILTRLAEE